MAAPHFICNSSLISMVSHSFVSRHKYCNNSDKTVFFICYYRLYFQKILKLCLYFPSFICYYRLYFQKFLKLCLYFPSLFLFFSAFFLLQSCFFLPILSSAYIFHSRGKYSDLLFVFTSPYLHSYDIIKEKFSSKD